MTSSIAHFTARHHCGGGLRAKAQRAPLAVGLGSAPRASWLRLRPDHQAFSSTFLITSTISGSLVILNTSICLQKASGLCFLRGNNLICPRLSLVTNTRKSRGISTLVRVRVPQAQQMLEEASLFLKPHQRNGTMT